MANLWRNADAVCFDVDSTVCSEEGIDILADFCGVGKQVEEWTSRAMDGNVKFEDALAARLDIIKPSQKNISACLEMHPPQLTSGIKTLIKSLHKNGTEVFLVSGGFRLMIEPVAELVNIPRSNIFANTIFFDDNGNYSGFDENELTSRDGGKPEVIQLLKDNYGFETVVMVGDGVTDMQAKPPADMFIGFGGVVNREIVRKNSDCFVSSFSDLLKPLQT